MSVTRLVAALGVAAMVTVPGCICSKKAPDGMPKPLVRKVCLEGSPRLNWYDGRANTLFVRIFQLSTPDAFAQADPPRLLEREISLPGSEGAPFERTLFPGQKDVFELRQHAEATSLGIVAGYFKLQGAGKLQRKLPPPPNPDDDEEEEEDEDEKAKPPADCIRFGPNGIEP